MPKVIKIMGMPDGRITPYDGMYVMECNFEAGFGTLAVNVTSDARQAKTFDTFEQAAEYWRTQSKTQPIRPDGKPNRPLTGVTVEIENAPTH